MIVTVIFWCKNYLDKHWCIYFTFFRYGSHFNKKSTWLAFITVSFKCDIKLQSMQEVNSNIIQKVHMNTLHVKGSISQCYVHTFHNIYSNTDNKLYVKCMYLGFFAWVILWSIEILISACAIRARTRTEMIGTPQVIPFIRHESVEAPQLILPYLEKFAVPSMCKTHVLNNNYDNWRIFSNFLYK